MNEEQLREMFPHGSEEFFRKTVPGLCSKKPEPSPGEALVDKTPREDKGEERPYVCIIMHRQRLLDPDNAYASTKQIIDCLREADLIRDDSEACIQLEVFQQKVFHKEDQKTEIEITYP